MNQRLLQFLSAENISQAQFADTIGVARASVSHILAGRNKPGFDFIESMSSHFPDLSLEWLINGKGKMYKSAAAPSAAFVQPAPQAAAPSPALQPAPSPAVIEPLEADMAPVGRSLPPSSSMPPKTVDSRPSGVSPSGRSIERIVVFYDDNTYQELK